MRSFPGVSRSPRGGLVGVSLTSRFKGSPYGPGRLRQLTDWGPVGPSRRTYRIRSEYMSLQTIDQGIATQVGHYADAVVIPAGYEQILVSATPGIDQDGKVSADVTRQTEQAWENVTKILEAAGAAVGAIVSVRHWVTNESNIGAALAVRTRYITHRPASAVAVVPGLERPEFLVAVEVIAARLPEE